ncbi:uncharacterized protein LOC142606108 [Castanea sativa]|uniref:uncharacterized protein LOC142606108 n=1 Tax=Castanea sativa TaxID=21020 RepID=UPI003F650941
MSKTLNLISKSPFTWRIEGGRLPRRFTQPMFTIYNGRMDPMENVDLPTEHCLRKLLIGKPVSNVRQLMDRIDKYKWVKENQQLGKGKAKVVPQDRRDFRSERRPGRIKISERCFFKTTSGYNQCYSYRPGRTGSHPSRILSIAQPLVKDSSPKLNRGRMEVRPTLSFSDEDEVSTLQPHDDALVVTLKIGDMVEGVKCEELENVIIGDDGEKFFQVEAQLPPREKEELVAFLRENIDVFAWSAYEAPG